MELPRILIGSPTSSVKDYAFLEWLMHLRQIDYPTDKLDILMVDNSKENGYEKYLQSWGIKTKRVHQQDRGSIEFICDSHNKIREYFLKKDYDYLLHLESDVMIQTQTLRTLLFQSQYNNIPVISASYFHGEDDSTNYIIHRIESYGQKRASKNLKFRECISNANKLVSLYACGIGCTLIRKDVFKNYNIKFRFKPNEYKHPDSFFYEDLFRSDIIPYLDTSIILKHNSSNWNHNPETLHRKI